MFNVKNKGQDSIKMYLLIYLAVKILDNGHCALHQGIFLHLKYMTSIRWLRLYSQFANPCY